MISNEHWRHRNSFQFKLAFVLHSCVVINIKFFFTITTSHLYQNNSIKHLGIQKVTQKKSNDKIQVKNWPMNRSAKLNNSLDIFYYRWTEQCEWICTMRIIWRLRFSGSILLTSSSAWLHVKITPHVMSLKIQRKNSF